MGKWCFIKTIFASYRAIEQQNQSLSLLYSMSLLTVVAVSKS